MRPNTGRSPDGRKLSEAAARSGGVDRHDGWRTACPLSGVRMVKQTFVNGVVSGSYAPQFPPFNLLIVVPKISRSFRLAASPRGGPHLELTCHSQRWPRTTAFGRSRRSDFCRSLVPIEQGWPIAALQHFWHKAIDVNVAAWAKWVSADHRAQ